jgi:hypothetical protein
MSLDLLVLLHQGKRTENIILRITIPKEKTRIKPRITALTPFSLKQNSAGELKSTAERSHRDSFMHSCIYAFTHYYCSIVAS